jgi:hypothetical protein
MTTRDEQTGLMNLGAFTFVVDHVVRRASRAGECATLLSLAMCGSSDRPRRATTLDVPVYRVARLLRTELRGEDVVARLGDLEFGIALPDTDGEGGEIVVAWLTSQLVDQGLLNVDAPEPAILIGRATFEPTQGPVGAGELLEAARASTDGPSAVVGRALPPVREAVGALERGGSDGRGAPRRHLRSLRTRES